MPSSDLQILGLSEPLLRGGVFVIVLAALILTEFLWPRKKRMMPRANRWLTNGGMLILATAMVRGLTLLLPAFAAGAAAIYATSNGFGLFQWIELPTWLEICLAIILLDFAIWLQHLITHKVPLLWKLHKVHHTDRDLDATSALRFHPFEIAVSALFKFALVFLFGAHLIAVVMFEIILNACAMFNHANISIPKPIDRLLRIILVTPDMHRVHHSIHFEEHNQNYGFCLSIWDRLFQTYTAEPKDGHQDMIIGLPEHQSSAPGKLLWSMTLPFKSIR